MYVYSFRISPVQIGARLIATPLMMFAGYVSILIVPMIVREVLAVVVPTVIAGVVGS